ncbi:serine hydrolase domain-containing protein [soil metagenome]
MSQHTRMESFVDELVASGRVGGAGLAAAVDGRTVFEHYAGCANPDVTAGPDVLWPIASISKLYTAAAIMRLVEHGSLTLGMRVVDVLPQCAGGGREEITLRQLMTHTSGLPNESPQMPDRMATMSLIEALIEEAFGLDLEFSPGTNQSYSDLGYLIAGQIASTVSGISFPELVRTLVLEPAALSRTFMPPEEVEYPRIAHVEGVFASDTSGAMYNSAYSRQLAHPAFGTVASLVDLLDFGLCFDPCSDRQLLSRAGILTMTSDQTCGDFAAESSIVPAGVIHAWGIGFSIKGRSGYPELASPEGYGHGGASGCYIWIDPRHRVTIAFVSNRHYNASSTEFMQRLDQALSVTLSSLT